MCLQNLFSHWELRHRWFVTGCLCIVLRLRLLEEFKKTQCQCSERLSKTRSLLWLETSKKFLMATGCLMKLYCQDDEDREVPLEKLKSVVSGKGLTMHRIFSFFSGSTVSGVVYGTWFFIIFFWPIFMFQELLWNGSKHISIAHK